MSAKGKRFTFQQSRIWEAGNPIDVTQPPVTIKARSAERAARKLPRPGLGRVWVLVMEVDR